MADFDVTAILAGIKERNEHLRSRYGYVGGLLALTGSKDDVPHPVAAIEAVLERHHPVFTDYADGDGIERSSYECEECGADGTPDNWPCPTYRAITSALAGTGKEGSDEH